MRAASSRRHREYATGRYSTREIAHRLNAEGVRLPRFTRGWRQDTVAQILGNVSYIGMTYVNRTRREGELIRGQWPELIDAITWATVRRMLDRHHRTSLGGVGNRVPNCPGRPAGLTLLVRPCRDLNPHAASVHGLATQCWSASRRSPVRSRGSIKSIGSARRAAAGFVFCDPGSANMDRSWRASTGREAQSAAARRTHSSRS